MKFICPIILVQCLASINAAELSTINLDKDQPMVKSWLSTESTSDSFDQQLFQVEYKNHRRDPLWPYEKETASAWDLGTRTLLASGNSPYGNYQAGLLVGSLGRKFSKQMQLDSELGIHQIHNHDKHTSRLLTWGLSSTYRSLSNWSVQFKVSRDRAYVDFGPGVAFSRLNSLRFNGRFIYRPVDKIKLMIKSSKAYLSDKNIRTHHDVEVLYGISTGNPWLWIGFGAERLEFSRDMSFELPLARYWSPNRFYAFGPRFDLNLPILPLYSFSLGASLSRIKENDLSSGTGFLLSPSIVYGSRDNSQLKLGYTRIDSRQNISKWNSDSFALTAQWSL